ncbi:Adaptor complexes medium subunit family-domain-containing protein [Xylaria bambusicola]|uniref:Adaptor complexes medium subunit family-domain-containing protein n=1 Tax=Xylaria bambusicola TaxID=326684 RepID=UPI002008C24E|nr:Adaptor complexes medium subunit family-domain-containing protein [Xylaria bambusicola]KAI0505981.1 Adaptor complexes medium subunit family-domain-containing protein [Xylaria bambusicola]
MNSVIEALHIYDEHKRAILSHTYTSRPLSAAHLLPLYLEHPAPRPSLIYLSNTNPPTLVFSLDHADLLYLATTSSDIEPLLVLEFLHRVIDALEEFLGAPILAHKIEANYDVVAQLLTEMCDAGTISTTEPNALRDVIEVEGLLGKLLGSINLPTKPLATSGTSSSLIAQNGPSLPWRRANVRHTSNELYADVVETLSVTLAPSGRPIAAFANGTIAFTSKVSGVPDIAVNLNGPSGKHNLKSIMELPVFHPCVRLSRWKDSPGELSFIPPDGRFILAGYEVDLLPFTNGKSSSMNHNLKLPLSIEVKTGLGSVGSDFEVRLNINKIFGPTSQSIAGPSARGGGGGGRGFGGPHAGTAASPSLQDVVVSVPLPSDVRNLSDVRPSRGDASYSPADRILEWHIPAKELSAGMSYFSLRCTVAGPLADDAVEEDPSGFGFGKDYAYDEPYQGSIAHHKSKEQMKGSEEERDLRKVAQNKILMPSSASVSFSVKGWTPSGIRVESIVVDPRKSRGLGEGIKPYKGVKYLTISKGGLVMSTLVSPLCCSPARTAVTSVSVRALSLRSSAALPCAPASIRIQHQPGCRRHGSTASSRRPRTAIFFPGQGVQKVGMLTPWLEAFPRSASIILEEIDSYMGYKLSDVIQNGTNRTLTLTPNAQPAIMATSILILRILERECGFKAIERVDVSLGHSLGEFAALVAAGVLEFEDALYMVRRRADSMAEATQKAREKYGGEYGMVAVVTEPEYLSTLVEAIDDFVGYRSAGTRSESADSRKPIDQVLIANINSKNQIVLSGSLHKIKELIAHVRQFLGHDPRAVQLNSDSPFHSPIMWPAYYVMRDLVSGKSRVKGREDKDIISFPGTMECISNVTARPFASASDVQELLARQCLETVRWWDSIKYLDQEQKVRRWIGIGPGKVGRNLVGKEVGMRGVDTVKGGGVFAITDPVEIDEVLKGLEKTEFLSEEEE